MAAPAASAFQQFLPPAPRPGAPQQAPPKAPPPKGGARPPAAPTARAGEADQARDLGRYGFNTLHLIEKDYTAALDEWKGAFRNILTAFATAVGQRDTVLEQAKAERERDAAIAAALLSLLTAGSMKLLSVYLEHIVLPAITVSAKADRIVKSIGTAGVPRNPALFSGAQAAAFGGLVEEAGKTALDQALKPSSTFPAPVAKQYPLDTPVGIDNLRTDFLDLFDASSRVVYDQFTAAQTWMNESKEFGAAWLADSKGNYEMAQYLIGNWLWYLAEVKWAQSWGFYGTTPVKFDRSRLARQFERSLWATYLLQRIDAAWGKKVKFLDPSYYPRVEDFPAWQVGEVAIVARLRELNVVDGETLGQVWDQMERARTSGEPVPNVRIVHKIDSMDETKAVMDWAKGYLGRVRVDTARDFFPPAVRRPAVPGLAPSVRPRG